MKRKVVHPGIDRLPHMELKSYLPRIVQADSATDLYSKLKHRLLTADSIWVFGPPDRINEFIREAT